MRTIPEFGTSSSPSAPAGSTAGKAGGASSARPPSPASPSPDHPKSSKPPIWQHPSSTPVPGPGDGEDPHHPPGNCGADRLVVVEGSRWPGRPQPTEQRWELFQTHAELGCVSQILRATGLSHGPQHLFAEARKTFIGFQGLLPNYELWRSAFPFLQDHEATVPPHKPRRFGAHTDRRSQGCLRPVRRCAGVLRLGPADGLGGRSLGRYDRDRTPCAEAERGPPDKAERHNGGVTVSHPRLMPGHMGGSSR